MRRLRAFRSKAACSIAALLACGIASADYTISNENIALGFDEFSFVGNMLSVFEFVGGRLDTGGPHDFWFDGFEGFARTTMTIRDSGGVLLAQRDNGLFWAVGPTLTRVTGPGMDSIVIEGQPMAGVFFRRTVRIDAGTKYARVTDMFTNNLGMVINPGVLDNVNAISPFGPNTFNDLQSVLGINDMATATIAPANTLTVSFGSNDPAMRFAAGGSQFLTNPFVMATSDPNGALVDSTTQAASNFGQMLPGAEFSHTWFISFGSTKAEATSVYVAATGAGSLSIGPVGDQFVDEHTLMSVSVPITNPGGGPVTWSVTGPPGMTISGAGTVTWTPGELDGGNSYNVDVQAMVGASVANTSFTVNVIETNTAPVIEPIGDVTVNEGGTAVADANASDSDVPVQGLTFSLASGPAGATVNSTTGAFSWVTSESHGPGAYPVTIRVRDDGPGLLTDETTFTVFVEEVNQAPTLNPISNKTVTAGANLTFAVSATDPDVPANTLTYTLEPGAPAGATINPSTGQFSWTPSGGNVGDHSVTVRVTDDGEPAMSDTESFMITVNAANLVIAYLGDHSGEYTDPTNLKVRITDASNNPIPGLPLTFTLGTFSGGATTDANGVAEVTHIINQPAGTPGVTVSFGGNGTFQGFAHNEPYEILREKVLVTYLGDRAVVVGGNLVDRATIRFYATAVQEADGYPGTLTGQALQYGAFLPGNAGSVPDVAVGPAPINAAGRSMMFMDLPAANYTVKVSMAPNDYWRVLPVVQFNLNIGMGVDRETSGSGWVPFGLGNGHANFDFKVSYINKKARGNSTFVFDGIDGANYYVEATTLMEGSLILGVGTQSWKSAFTGFAKVVRTMGGSQQFFYDVPFTVDAWDGGMSGPAVMDAYGILLLDNNGYIWLETPGILNLGGGNIKIR